MKQVCPQQEFVDAHFKDRLADYLIHASIESFHSDGVILPKIGQTCDIRILMNDPRILEQLLYLACDDVSIGARHFVVHNNQLIHWLFLLIFKPLLDHFEGLFSLHSYVGFKLVLVENALDSDQLEHIIVDKEDFRTIGRSLLTSIFNQT